MADEKKRIIDLSELSQEVQVGQYILVDSASGTGKMNLKKIVDDSTTSLAERVTDLETGLTEEENARIAADTELSGSISNLQTALETKADKDGYYPDLYAGNLSSTRKQTDSTPYLMRKTGGDLSRIGEREDDTLVGATVRANQLLHDMRQSGTQNGLTFTNTNGALTITGTVTEAFSYNYIHFTDSLTQFIRDGRKYLVTLNKAIPYAWGVSGYSPSSASVNSSATMFTNTTGGIWQDGLIFRAPVGTTVNITDLRANIIDLTAEFGSASIADYIYSLETATAGAGVAKLREWGFLAGEYIPYNAGTLESVEATAHKMVGFNLFNKDEAVEGVYICDSNGSEGTTQGAISTGWIPVIGGEDYFIVNTATSGRWGAWYDADKIFISTCVGDGVKTAPLNARYMRMTIKSSKGSLGSVDTFCFSLSSDRNGEYEPYSAHTYDLGTDTLRGLFKLDSNNELYADGDTKASDGTIARKYGVVDLGTLAFTYDSSGKRWQVAFANIENFATRSANVIAEKYTADITATAGNEGKMFTIGKGLYIYSNDSTTPPSGNLIYPLATPTTETSTPFQNPQICDPDGTEEYVTSNGVPVGHVTEYDYDIKGLAEELIDVPDVPSSNGTYVLKATRTADGLTYSWVAG